MVPLNSKTRVIVIGGSAGSFQVVCNILANLPSNFQIPIVLCLHRLKHIREGFVEALSIKSNLPIIEPNDKQGLKNGNIYLAPSNYHLGVEIGHYFSLSTEEMVNYSRPSINITFDSFGFAYKEKLMAILLSGANKDGAIGMKQIEKYNGRILIQDPKECKMPTMPSAAIDVLKNPTIVSEQKIIQELKMLNSL